MNKVDIELLNELIEDLRKNPNACTLYSSNYQKGIISFGESNPGQKLKQFIQYLYDNNLMDKNYLENNDKIKEKEIKDMNIDEIFTRLTWIIRADRFNSGLIYSYFKNGMILNLVERLVQLINNN